MKLDPITTNFLGVLAQNRRLGQLGADHPRLQPARRRTIAARRPPKSPPPTRSTTIRSPRSRRNLKSRARPRRRGRSQRRSRHPRRARRQDRQPDDRRLDPHQTQHPRARDERLKMDIRAAEISKVIRDQIANFGTEAAGLRSRHRAVGRRRHRPHPRPRQRPGRRDGRVRQRHQGHGAQPRGRQCRRRDLRLGRRDQAKATPSSAPAPSSTCRSARACSAASSTASATRSTARARS